MISLRYSRMTNLSFFIAHKSHLEGEMSGRRRDSSIKKILSNQSLEKQEYDGKLSSSPSNLVFDCFRLEINQKVQNSTSSQAKPSSNNDPAGLERSNSIGGRK